MSDQDERDEELTDEELKKASGGTTVAKPGDRVRFESDPDERPEISRRDAGTSQIKPV